MHYLVDEAMSDRGLVQFLYSKIFYFFPKNGQYFFMKCLFTQDMHWTPVFDHCSPCQVNFSHIVKFESFDRDQREILKLARVEEKVIYIKSSNFYKINIVSKCLKSGPTSQDESKFEERRRFIDHETIFETAF